MKDEKVFADAADLELQIDMLEEFDANSDDKYNTLMICWLKELQQRRALQSGNSAQPVTVPDGLRLALSNAGIAAPESDDMLFATHEKYVQLLVNWVKDRKPFATPAGYVLVPVEPTPEMMLHKSGCQHHAWNDPHCPLRETRRLVWSHMLTAVQKGS